MAVLFSNYTRKASFLLCGGEEAANIARSLSNALFILDEGKADIFVAIFTKANAGGDSHMGFLNKALCELQRADGAEFLRYRHPCKHGRVRARDCPTCTGKALHHDVATIFIDFSGFLDAFLGAIQRRSCCDLYGGKGTIIEIGFDARQGADHPLVANRQIPCASRAWRRSLTGT